jgi:hypothetical protein
MPPSSYHDLADIAQVNRDSRYTGVLGEKEFNIFKNY